MAKRVFLHVGMPKSGTTYVQAVLSRNKRALAEREGLLFPGDDWSAQVRGARDVLDFSSHVENRSAAPGAWRDLVDEIGAWHGDAIVSMEWLGSATTERVERMVATLAPATVEVVVTVRDLARTLPAAWQEFMQNWETWSWQEFLESVSAEDPTSTPPGRLFWGQQDLGRFFANYSSVDPQRIHVVTLPPPGASSTELLVRLGRVLDVDFAGYDLTGGGNESLGLESTLAMRQVNLLSRRDQVPWPVYDRFLKNGLAKRGLSRRKPQESGLVVPEHLRDWVAARTKDQVAAITASGAHVHGDLDDLLPHYPSSGLQPEDISVEAVLEAAIDGLVWAARDASQRQQRQAQVAQHPVRTALVALSEKHRGVGVARRGFVRVRDAARRRSRH